MAIVIHNINGNFYAYEHYRSGDKVISEYLYPVSSNEKYQVVYVSEFKGNNSTWRGMNSEAAKELKIDYPYPKNTIVIAKDADRKRQTETLRHEIIEIQEMRRGKKYAEAHEIANKKEKLEKIDKEGAGGYQKPYMFKGERNPSYKGKKVLGTVKKGKVPITSQKQMGKLHREKIDHTHYTFDEQGNIKSKVRHVY